MQYTSSDNLLVVFYGFFFYSSSARCLLITFFLVNLIKMSYEILELNSMGSHRYIHDVELGWYEEAPNCNKDQEENRKNVVLIRSFDIDVIV